MDTKTLCLGALSMGDETGYDIKKRFEDSFAYFLEASPSGIYRALGELEAEGAVETEYVVQTGRPNKKKLSLTETGRERLASAAIASPARHRVRSEFLFVLLMAHLLPPEHVSSLLDRHVEEMAGLSQETEAWLEEIGDDAPAGMRFVGQFGLDMLKAHMNAIERHRALLESSPPAAASNPATGSKATPRKKENADV